MNLAKWLLKPLMTTKGESDPEPTTYLAKLFHKARYDKLSSLLKQLVGRKVNLLIDVGCRKGTFWKWLKKNEVSVDCYVGCDIDAAIMHRSRNIERVVCDAHHLPFRTSVAEVVVCSEVLEHLQNPYSAIDELLRVSENWTLVSFPDEKIKNALGFRYPEHISNISLIGLEHIAERRGWKLVRAEKMYFAFPPSVLDNLNIRFSQRRVKFLSVIFETLSATVKGLCLIKTVIIVFKRKCH